ncbi:MAG: hypothetical protein EHM72_06725 [Calditrichaeota bacterium]|nr:MAG: hypothetical protein EHM72_06725 [Calditrichota bacterium]
MVKKWYLPIVLLVLGASTVFAQMDKLHGEFLEVKSGIHAGNMFRLSFYNDGTYGKISPDDIGGEWLHHPGSAYLLDGEQQIGSEVLDIYGNVKHILSTNRSTDFPGTTNSGDYGPDGEWWTFLPLPGFASSDSDKVAMSKWRWSWPTSWPDRGDDPIDPGWPGSWNGYFGKNQFNADEESYYVVDDYMNREFAFYPDENDSTRKGLGLRMFVRGFQWANALVEDGLFLLFDVKNIGTHFHDKMVFSFKIGNNMGDLGSPGDTNDDNGAYDLVNDIAYMWDNDDLGVGGWGPVGFMGASLLESPGNPRDGIDNDGDGGNGQGKILTEADFVPKQISTGDRIILIDYKTFKRTEVQMPNDTLEILYLDQVFKFWPGKIVEELPYDLVDNNLNGLIDENRGSVIGTPPNEIQKYLYIGAKCIDYFSGNGISNLLLDERRDDGIDNDQDWDPRTDDVGQDGASFSGDIGEGDGLPTNGEPHFDKTDIDETDMLGLTSFTLYFWPDIPLWDDEAVWQATKPGFLDDAMQNSNVDLFWGSGYFPMAPTEIERFSMGFVLGVTKDDLLTNKYWFAKAYNENYNFSKAPGIPTLTTIPGDNRVTLVWDDFAEQTTDPILGKDFEGYRIYRSTDPFWRDMEPITDGQGAVTFRKPLAQFDLVNEYEGYAPNAVKGVQFWLGTNTGITHTFIDSTVKNGITYYYAVTSYDHGDPLSGLPPSECTKFISVNQAYEIMEKGSNVQKVRPEAPVAGYVPPSADAFEKTGNSTTDGFVTLEVVFPEEIKEKNDYRITFNQALEDKIFPRTKSFSLLNITSGDTLLKESVLFNDQDELPITEGFRLKFHHSFVVMDAGSVYWNRAGICPVRMRNHTRYKDNGILPQNGDFIAVIGEVGIDTSVAFPPKKPELPAIPANFKIINIKLNKKMKFAFGDKDVNPGEEGMLTSFSTGTNKRDLVIILSDSLVPGWEFELIKVATALTDTLQPQLGDTLYLNVRDPFLAHDSLDFRMNSEFVDTQSAVSELDQIRVVPNPYIITADWEPLNPYTSGRGPRELHFINVPEKCTLRIFNISGQLIRELDHETSSLANGTIIWDMQTKDMLDVSYGVYIYHIDAGEFGEKIGKFAIIK